MNLESGVLQVHIEDIIPNRFQPRLTFDEQGLKELSDSIKEHGIIQPLVLRKLGDKYEIIAGERRFKAAQMAGLTTVPAVISNIDDNKSAEVALVENVQRRDLTAIEEARSYKSLLDKGYLTQDQLAKRMGLSQPAIANKLRLLNLDEEVQQALLEEKISERHARTLLTIKNKEEQKEWLHRIINERLTVRQLDLELKKVKSENSQDDGIPLVDDSLSVEQIRNNAVDINPIREKMSSEDIMKPQPIEEEVEMLDDSDSDNYIKATNKVPEMNIATPNFASTYIDNEPVMSNVTDNRFFNFNNGMEQVEQVSDEDEDSTSGFEVFDKPDSLNNSIFESDYNDSSIDVMPEDKVESDFSSNNKFFTPINDVGNEIIEKDEELINPMDSVDKISPDYVDPEKVTQDVGLKNAINSIRSTIQGLGDKGFFINVEEIDFDSDYQITIRIKKDN